MTSEEPILTSNGNTTVPVQALYPTVCYILTSLVLHVSNRLIKSEALEGLQASPTEHLDY